MVKPSISLTRARPSDASRGLTLGFALDHELAVLARLKRRAEEAVEQESASESFLAARLSVPSNLQTQSTCKDENGLQTSGIPSEQNLDPRDRLRNCAGFAGTAT